MDNKEALVVGKFCGMKVVGSLLSMKMLEVRTAEEAVPEHDSTTRVEFWLNGVGADDGPSAILYATSKEDLQKVYSQLSLELDNVVMVSTF